MTAPFVIDGIRQPKPEPMKLTLRDPDILRLPAPLVFEDVSLEAFIEAGGWLVTVPQGLRG